MTTAAPLAARLRPTSLDDYVGQGDVVALIRKLLASGSLPSLLLWGPPGVGKTTLARCIANSIDAAWEELSAVTAGVKDVRECLTAARSRREMDGTATVLFLDEIHRFNKSQQDALLPGVEDGTITLVGATTENPFFELNAPLLSRCRLFRLEPLDEDAIGAIVARAVEHPDGLAGAFALHADVAEVICAVADGDARAALNTLEAAAAACGQERVIRAEHVDESVRRLRYDKSDDGHYDQVSAFIKSLRGSDPDAAVYWLTRMLTAGEDPRFLARRMVVFASEDVGMADRSALPLAVAAFQAVERVGMPEARYNLTHAAIQLAVAPKSNSTTMAMRAADELVAKTGNLPVPTHLRDAHYRAAKKLGHGVGYEYPHNHPGSFVHQQYLPDGATGRRLYRPTGNGHEAPVGPRLSELWPDRR